MNIGKSADWAVYTLIMHNHNHHHPAHDSTESRRIGLAFFLNLGFTLIEFVGGWLTNSSAIMADAIHDLGDSLSIGMAWLLSQLSKKQPNATFSYGYRRFSLLGALINGLVLIAGSLWVLSESIPKLLNPQMPMVEGMLGLAVLGITVNGYAAWKLSRGKTLNEQILNWHLLEDVLGWVAVLIVSVVLLFVDWPILDPALSIAFTVFILFNVFRNLWATTLLFLQASPADETVRQIQKWLEAFPEIESIHHLHLWSLDGEHHVMSVHAKLKAPLLPEKQVALKQAIAEKLKPLELAHTTIEFEFPGEDCRDHESHVAG